MARGEITVKEVMEMCLERQVSQDCEGAHVKG